MYNEDVANRQKARESVKKDAEARKADGNRRVAAQKDGLRRNIREVKKDEINGSGS